MEIHGMVAPERLPLRFVAVDAPGLIAGSGVCTRTTVRSNAQRQPVNEVAPLPTTLSTM